MKMGASWPSYSLADVALRETDLEKNMFKNVRNVQSVAGGIEKRVSASYYMRSAKEDYQHGI